MAHDMFGQVSARRPTARGRQSTLIAVSVTAHVVAVVAFLAASLFMPVPLPSPPTAMAYQAPPRLVQLADIPLPSTPRPTVARPGASADASTASAPVETAPVVAPSGVGPETGREGVITTPEVSSTVGIGTGADGIGSVERLGPPAPVAPAPVEPVRLHSGIQAPQRTMYMEPVYPAIARAARAQGPVILEAVIDADGRVTSVRVLRSIALLDQAAIAAVQQWRFTPARLNGEAIPVVMTVTVNFTLN